MQLRTRLGSIVLDLPRFLLCTFLYPSRPRLPGWAWNRNRDDLIIPGPKGEGIVCQWEFTRSLHLTNVFPSLSSSLLRRMLSDFPVQLLEQPAPAVVSENPEVTFVIGHRGTKRLPHLLLTLMSIAGQTGISIECIVVEQSYKQELVGQLPSWVRYHFTRTPSNDYLYNRSWALNEGARLANGSIVILHDGDMLVPTGYAAEMKYQADSGYDVVNLKRFISFLDQESSEFVFQNRTIAGPLRAEQMMENATAGGSIGIQREAFFAIGAMDEEFVGWGGEDTEFWDRCQTLQVANHTYMPIIHLWHPSQPGKAAVNGLGQSTGDLFLRRMQVSTRSRIDLLRDKNATRTLPSLNES
jgi:hypothetical protein